MVIYLSFRPLYTNIILSVYLRISIRRFRRVSTQFLKVYIHYTCNCGTYEIFITQQANGRKQLRGSTNGLPDDIVVIFQRSDEDGRAGEGYGGSGSKTKGVAQQAVLRDDDQREHNVQLLHIFPIIIIVVHIAFSIPIQKAIILLGFILTQPDAICMRPQNANYSFCSRVQS